MVSNSPLTHPILIFSNILAYSRVCQSSRYPSYMLESTYSYHSNSSIVTHPHNPFFSCLVTPWVSTIKTEILGRRVKETKV